MCACSTSDDEITCANSAKTLATYNRRQNKLRHFALNWPFLRFTDFKMWKYSFSSPSPLCNVVPLFKRPIKNNKHSNFDWRDMGGIWILLFSEVTLFEYNVSTILWPIVAIIAWGKRQNHFFIPIFMSLFAIYIKILFSRFSRPTTIVTALLHMRWDHVFTRASWKSSLTPGLGTSPWGLSSMDREQVRKAILKKIVDQVSS